METHNGLYIDSRVRVNEARFINHSCQPNCRPEKWEVAGRTRIGFFASEDIPKVEYAEAGVYNQY